MIVLPVSKCENGKWKIGSGECRFASKAKAEAAFKHWVENENGKWNPGDKNVILEGGKCKTIILAEEMANSYGKNLDNMMVTKVTFEAYDQEHE